MANNVIAYGIAILYVANSAILFTDLQPRLAGVSLTFAVANFLLFCL